MKTKFLCFLVLIFIIVSLCSCSDAKSEINADKSSFIESSATSSTVKYAEQVKKSGSKNCTACLFLPNNDASNLVKVYTEYDGTINDLIAKLVLLRALPKETSVKSFRIIGSTANIDLTKEFGLEATTTGSAGELMLIGSLVDTVIENFGVNYVKITVEGRVLITGHNDYSKPIAFISF